MLLFWGNPNFCQKIGARLFAVAAGLMGVPVNEGFFLPLENYLGQVFIYCNNANLILVKRSRTFLLFKQKIKIRFNFVETYSISWKRKSKLWDEFRSLVITPFFFFFFQEVKWLIFMGNQFFNMLILLLFQCCFVVTCATLFKTVKREV